MPHIEQMRRRKHKTARSRPTAERRICCKAGQASPKSTGFCLFNFLFLKEDDAGLVMETRPFLFKQWRQGKGEMCTTRGTEHTVDLHDFFNVRIVFLSKNDCSMVIGNILQHDRRIGIQCLRSLDRYTPNMEFNLHKRRLFHEELGKALVEPEMMMRETLSRTAAAKTAVERLRQESDQPSTSASTDTDRSGKKKEPHVNCVFQVTST
ncbi:hypothetical protein T07_13425 [Trichinella nelsoni]|uniref:Uncharacterized protein n=1 Tax=Trichinella nelsoni TaxID=6336 RepID=A0A0V0RWW1_9BILA|nr:hypothetical protein T07_13425 [Trichinella nelsoni]